MTTARLAAVVIVLAALARPVAAGMGAMGRAPALAPAPGHREHAHWWIWGGVAAAVVVTAVALSSPGASTVHAGTLRTLNR